MDNTTHSPNMLLFHLQCFKVKRRGERERERERERGREKEIFGESQRE